MADNFVLIKNWFNLGFPIAIPMRGIARNCAELRATVFKFLGIVRSCAQLLGVYKARHCAQLKVTCVGNPSLTQDI